MERYLQKFNVSTYIVPPQLVSSIHRASAQIVATWFIIQRYTPYTYISLHTCRSALSAACSWDAIGVSLKRLLDVHIMPTTLLPLQSIGQGNTTVIIGHFGGASLTAIKQQVFSRGSWEVSSHILAELMALQKLKTFTWSPAVYFHSVSQDMVQIGMEYIPLSMKQMVRFGTRQIEFSRRIIIQLLTAVHALHDCRMIHRDIKPDNIRFRSNGDLVLIDYDSCMMRDGMTEKTRCVCTSGYRDPYLFDGGCDLTSYDYQMLDGFSVGAVFLYILNGGKHMFTGKDDSDIVRNMTTYIAKGLDTFCVRSKLPAVDRSVLCGLLSIDPQLRMTITQAYTAYKSRV
jgi:serine/threonine protein kinase